MKTKTSIASLLLALILVFSVSIAVSAAPAPIIRDEMSVVSLDENGTPAYDTPENPSADTPGLQGDTPAGPEAPAGAEQAAEETAPAPQKSNNTPFFIGAGIAVLLFIGVALYCKANGTKTL